VGAETFPFPEGLGEFDTILIAGDHRDYQAIPVSQIMANLKKCRLILDNTGIWEGLGLREIGVEYHLAGTVHWLGE